MRHTGIERLAVDTHGYTHFAAGIGKALGIDLCVRPSGMADRKLYLPRGFAVPEGLAPITRCSIAPGTISKGYDAFLRVAASLKHGWCSASWLIERFGSAAKGNPGISALLGHGFTVAPCHRRRLSTSSSRHSQVKS